MPSVPRPVESERQVTDGRVLRASRTRRLVVEALLDLLDAGEPQPTAQQVSDRSGVSMRSVFRLFDDVEALHAAAVATQVERVGHLLGPLNASGALEQRVKTLVDSRANLFETISPVRRMAVRLSPTSRTIRADLEVANAFLRSQVADQFDAELRALPTGRRRDVLDAVDAAASWETWERLRTTQGVSVQRSRRLLADLLGRTLRAGSAPEPARNAKG